MMIIFNILKCLDNPSLYRFTTYAVYVPVYTKMAHWGREWNQWCNLVRTTLPCIATKRRRHHRRDYPGEEICIMYVTDAIKS